MNIKTLIDSAAKVVGNRNKLAQKLEIPSSKIYDWYDSRVPCQPIDRTRMAGIAGLDPVQELLRSVIETTAGTTRGDQLASMLAPEMRNGKERRESARESK